MTIHRTGGVIGAERNLVLTGVALDGGTIADWLTVSGGPCEIKSFLFHLTEAVSAHACDMKLVSDPTVGTGGDICAAFDINAATIATAIDLGGGSGDALVAYVDTTALAETGVSSNGIVVFPGFIDLNLANNNPTSGIASVYIRYVPRVTGARIS